MWWLTISFENFLTLIYIKISDPNLLFIFICFYYYYYYYYFFFFQNCNVFFVLVICIHVVINRNFGASYNCFHGKFYSVAPRRLTLGRSRGINIIFDTHHKAKSIYVFRVSRPYLVFFFFFVCCFFFFFFFCLTCIPQSSPRIYTKYFHQICRRVRITFIDMKLKL